MGSATGRGDGRDPLDRYFTPQDLADVLVAQVKGHLWKGEATWPFPPTILEPSCGQGAWVRAVRKSFPGCHVTGVDLDPVASGLDLVDVPHWSQDFLDFHPAGIPRPGGRFDLVLGNPPFRHAQAHVEHALNQGQVVGFLLRLGFLESRQRVGFWKSHPATRIWVLAERPSFTGKGTDASAYGFFMWDRDHHGPTRLDVLSWKGEARQFTTNRPADPVPVSV